MQIQLAYQTWNGVAPVIKFLPPEEYFDPLGRGESYEADGVPRWLTDPRYQGEVDPRGYMTGRLPENKSFWL